MFCITKLLFILCTVQVIKSLSVQLDGDNLGSTWKYEYGVAGENFKAAPSRSRNPNDADRIRKDEEKLRQAEERLRNQASAHRNKLSNHMRLGQRHARKKDEPVTERPSLSDLFAPLISWLQQYISFNNTMPIKDRITLRPPTSVPPAKQIVFDSDSDAIDSDTTVREMSTRPLGRNMENSELDSSHTHESSEFKLQNSNSEQTNIWKGLIVNGDASVSSFEATNKYDIPLAGVEHRAGPTDVEKSVLPVKPHKVKDDTKITEFTNNLFEKTMNLFDNVEKEMNDENVKTQIKKLGKNYEDKFQEFLRDTSKQTIRTRLGTQKVVLSAIEMSDRILRRLLNFMVADMDGKGTPRNNDNTARTFKSAIEKEQKTHMLRACKKFGICRSGPVFSGFVADIMSILLKMDSKTFNKTLNVIIKVIKSTNFQGILAKRTEEKLKSSLRYVDLHKFKPMLVLLRNIISNKNGPLIVNNAGSRRRIVDSTVSLLEIIDLLDRKIPTKKSMEWKNLRDNLQQFADGKRTDLEDITVSIVERIMQNFRELNKHSREIISKNLDVILDSFHY